MDNNKILGFIAIVWIVVCLYFVVMGGKHKRSPKPQFDKIPIILGILIAGVLGLLAVIGAIFFN